MLVEWRKPDHSIAVAVISQWRRCLSACVREFWTEILSTFCGVFTAQCVNLMLRIFEFGVLLFDCFVYRQSVTCLKRFTRYGHYAGEVEDMGRLAVVS